MPTPTPNCSTYPWTTFKHLVKNEPLIASKMLMGMAKELSYRLRLTSIEVRTLEE